MRLFTSNSKRLIIPAAVFTSTFLAMWVLYANFITPTMLVYREIPPTPINIDKTIISEAFPADSITFLGSSRFGCGIHPSIISSKLNRDVRVIWRNGAKLHKRLSFVDPKTPATLIVNFVPKFISDRDDNEYNTSGWEKTREEIDGYLAYKSDIKRRNLVIPLSVMEAWKGRGIEAFLSKFFATANFKRAQFPSDITHQIKDNMLLLKNNGWRIIAIRMPIHKQLYDFESISANSQQLKEFAESCGIEYLDYSKANYYTYDGSHLSSNEAQRFSETLALDLAKLLKD